MLVFLLLFVNNYLLFYNLYWVLHRYILFVYLFLFQIFKAHTSLFCLFSFHLVLDKVYEIYGKKVISTKSFTLIEVINKTISEILVSLNQSNTYLKKERSCWIQYLRPKQ